MYCSRCDSYIPAGLDLQHCPVCNVDITTEAPPKERLKPEIEVPESTPEKNKPDVLESEIKPDFTIGHAFFLSFFSPSFYIDVVRKWKGACLMYLFILSSFVSCLLNMRALQEYEKWHYEYIVPVANSVPDISIENGKMRILQKSPYYLWVNDRKILLAVFDTSAALNATSLAAALGFSADGLYTKNNNALSHFEPYGEKTNVKVNNVVASYIAEQWLKWLPFFTYIFLWPVHLLVLLLSAFIFSILALPIMFITKAGLNYAQIFRICCMTITPSVILETLFGFVVDKALLKQLPWLHLLPLVYLIFATVVWHFEKKRTKQVQAEESQKKKAKPPQRPIFYVSH